MAARYHLPIVTAMDPRAEEFLLESNAIEGITNIDYRDPAHRQPGRGHWGALLLVLEKASQYPIFNPQDADGWGQAVLRIPYRPLALDDICAWQSLITAEQVEAGHALRPDAIGSIRSDSLPVDVYVGRHVAPAFAEVPERMRQWLDSLNQGLARQPAPFATEVTFVDCLGSHFQWFEAIHPFVDGNGRVGRLIANYVATLHQRPLIVFRAGERPAYYAAHRNKAAMRVFIADKIRERVRMWSGEIADREKSYGATDSYRTASGSGTLVEWHDLLRAQAEWTRAAGT